MVQAQYLTRLVQALSSNQKKTTTMKILKYLKISAALVAGVVMTSCSSDFLEAENKSSGGQNDEDYFSKHPDALMYYSYATLQDIASTVDIYEQGTDLYVANRVNQTQLMDFSLSSSHQDSKDLYTNCYSAISYANGAIKYAGASSEIGQQSRFLRAYCYYVLTQQFGGVPYITSYVQNSSRNYPRTALSTIYPDLISDLTDVYNTCSLPEGMNPSNPGKVSKQAVAALIAKLNLAAGWDLETTSTDAENGKYTVNGTTYFAEAEKWAGLAIGNASLAGMSFADMWKQENDNTNTQVIFSVQYNKENYPGDKGSGGHSLQNNFGGYYGSTKASGCKNAGSANSQSVKSMYLWEEGDARFDVTYMTTVYNSTKISGSEATWGTEGYYGYYNNANPDALNIFIKYFPWYTSEADAKAYLTANAARFQQGACANTNPRAFILTSPNVKWLTVDASGNVTVQEQDVETFNKRNDGGCISVKKFDDKNSDVIDSKNDYRNIVIFSLADMFLTRAEARLMQSNTSGFYADVNVVRNRAGLASITDISQYNAPYLTLDEYANLSLTELDLLLDECAREFYAENHRYIDLRRTKQLVKYNVLFNKYVDSAAKMKPNGEFKLYRPIDQTIIDKNDALSIADQNPGY